jgi:hypothetical protein
MLVKENKESIAGDFNLSANKGRSPANDIFKRYYFFGL